MNTWGRELGDLGSSGYIYIYAYIIIYDMYMTYDMYVYMGMTWDVPQQ